MSKFDGDESFFSSFRGAPDVSSGYQYAHSSARCRFMLPELME
jgi:hypothetical protein